MGDEQAHPLMIIMDLPSGELPTSSLQKTVALIKLRAMKMELGLNI